ncbi:hypothetical protein ACSQ76_08360 [Roseovarius sp. B08]|uniref:hypothetical protein n=1 Tax=Roseovarius sp. B08 TaxID=3449223 RepID=UPI003EDC5836
MAEHLAKRKELWEARKVGGATCTTKKPQHQRQFASETSEKTGVNKSTVNRAVSRAQVSEEARDAIRGTDLDRGTVLDELKKVEPERQLGSVG